MKLTLETITKSGGFVGGIVKRDVEWEQDGEVVKAETYVRPMSYHTAVQDLRSVEKNIDLTAQRIAMCICHEDGSPVFQISDITGIDAEGKPIKVKGEDGKLAERGPLNRNLTNALLALIGEVSGLGKKRAPTRTPAKKSRSRRKSGTN